MANQRRDGSILSAALMGGQHRKAVELDFGMYRCMVTKVYYVDDEGNLTFENKQVTYDVLVLGGRKEGQVIPNVKAASLLGGQYNYHERIYRATEFPFSGPTKKPLNEHNGDIVYIQFVNGNTSLPVIIGAGVSTLDKTTTGATKEDGHVFREQYNGIKKSINKEGDLTLERFGGEWDPEAGYFKPAEEAETIIKLQKEEKLTINFKSGMVLSIDGKEDKVTATTGNSDYLELSKDEGVIARTQTGATLTLKNGKVALGGPTAELLEEISNSLQELISHMEDLQIETHNGNLGYPTATPLNSASYSATAGALTGIKSLIDGIKGTI